MTVAQLTEEIISLNAKIEVFEKSLDGLRANRIMLERLLVMAEQVAGNKKELGV